VSKCKNDKIKINKNKIKKWKKIIKAPEKAPRSTLVFSSLADPTSFMREQMLTGLPSMRFKQVWLSW
jgi:hypothetical protein